MPRAVRSRTGWLGVVVDGPLITPGFAQADAEWDRMATSGVESVRAAFYWHEIQPNGPAELNFAVTDAITLAAAAARARRPAGRPPHARAGRR